MSELTLENFQKSLEKLQSENQLEIYFDAYRVLFRLLVNIGSHPQQQKYRTLNKTNQTIQNKLLNCKGIQHTLSVLSYTQQSPQSLQNTIQDQQTLSSIIEHLRSRIDKLKVQTAQKESLPQFTPTPSPEVSQVVEQTYPVIPPLQNQLIQDQHDFKLEWSGSFYDGPIKSGWFQDKGRFTFPSGVVYQGEFHKGEFHGKGTLIFPNGGKYIANWNRGRVVDGEYEYYDGLKYQATNWEYCKIPDRRFYTEIKEGLRPAGDTLIVNDPAGPKPIPKGTYDLGEGYYEPENGNSYNYEAKMLNPIEDEDLQEVLKKYRYNPQNLEDRVDEEGE